MCALCCFCLRPRLRRFARASSHCPRRSSTASRLSYLQTHAPSPTMSQQLLSLAHACFANFGPAILAGCLWRHRTGRECASDAVFGCGRLLNLAVTNCRPSYRAITTLNCKLMIALTPIRVPDHNCKRLCFNTYCLVEVAFCLIIIAEN